MHSTCSSPSVVAASLSQALAADRLDEADELLADWAGPLPREVALLAVDLHLRRCRFTQALAILESLDHLDIHGRLKRNVARNYASLQLHRPEVYRRLVAARLTDRYRLAPVAGNRLTIADLKVPQRPTLLTPGNDPVIAVQRTITQLEPRLKEGAAVGLVGIGDGYVMGTLARISPKLYMDMQVAVHLFEPDLSLLHLCLTLHDYAGGQGPIEQKRFQWHVGEDWERQYRAVMERDLYLPRPGVIVQQSTDRSQITPVIHEVGAALDRREADCRARSHQHYAAIDPGELSRRIAGSGDGEPPRVLLLTSRFTTVLQYATRGVASAFESLGWRTLTLIEPSPFHQTSRLTMAQSLADFKPDLVFQIDHLRHEHDESFPPGLPFVCWIQDHLPHLTKLEAGRQVGERDFVLTFASPLFIDTYGYPPRQCIDMPMMLTVPQEQSEAARIDAPDLVYVSNVSQQPHELVEAVIRRTEPAWRELAAQAAARLRERYEQGGSLSNHHEVRQLLEEVITTGGHPRPQDAVLRRIVEDLWNPLNTGLHRQQALRWVVEAARSLGLSLGIYGQGWERHPDFAPYARGVIQNGQPLAQLTRSARINLNLEPYVCFTHQRLLDGLVAGGFCLIRHHPGNTLLQELLNFIESLGDDAVQTTAQAIKACPADRRDELQSLIRRAACLTFEENADPVRQVRCWQRAGVLIRQDVALPHLDEVTFHDQAGCRTLIERFIHAADRRESIAAAQRRSVEGRLSFVTGMRMVTRRIAALLAEETRSKGDDKDGSVTAGRVQPKNTEAA